VDSSIMLSIRPW